MKNYSRFGSGAPRAPDHLAEEPKPNEVLTPPHFTHVFILDSAREPLGGGSAWHGPSGCQEARAKSRPQGRGGRFGTDGATVPNALCRLPL